ncbi:MAG: RNA polymerase subunit sigma-70 [Rhodanobacter denitrificans]|uniref:RNA polymerase subunit sigma-70 n=1 Tax=Rhodanobacter denitrificans TaxID=666685 RepID=A0A2W5MUT8_9GAMM|nr:MAG: RNA polymerase subunit sigma-70 [Rhodanobacter denitrificans]
MSRNAEVTRWIQAWQAGDARALDKLLPLVYADLRAIAARRLADGPRQDTLQPTALVHDVFVRLVEANGLRIEDGSHLFNVVGGMMRRLLIDRARHGAAGKHGGELRRADFDEALDLPLPETDGLAALDAALDRLAEIEPRLARIVELRYFVGLTVPEVAAVLEVDKRTVYRDWAFARNWLRTELAP